MTLNTVEWAIDIVAKSSIVHREVYTAGTDTFTLFRREKTIADDGTVLQVPIVSGSSFRGVLRRIGEELTAAILGYDEDAALPVPAAHLLTNGGRLAKSANPFTDEDERHLKSLLPQVAVFGGSASGRIMEGLLAAGNVVPEVAETAHMLYRKPQSPLLPAVRLLADESFTHLSDHRTSTGQPPHTDVNENTSPLGRFGVETLPAGTRLQTWVSLTHATDHQTAFVRDILDTFATHGHLGGRIAAGHGTLTATLSAKVRRGQLPDDTVDWEAELKTHRDDALAALSKIT